MRLPWNIVEFRSERGWLGVVYPDVGRSELWRQILLLECMRDSAGGHDTRKSSGSQRRRSEHLSS